MDDIIETLATFSCSTGQLKYCADPFEEETMIFIAKPYSSNWRLIRSRSFYHGKPSRKSHKEFIRLCKELPKMKLYGNC